MSYILDEEIESWKDFPAALRIDDVKLFKEMLDECYQFKETFEVKGEEFSTESLLMTLIFIQHKMIGQLIKNITTIQF